MSASLDFLDFLFALGSHEVFIIFSQFPRVLKKILNDICRSSFHLCVYEGKKRNEFYAIIVIFSPIAHKIKVVPTSASVSMG